MVLCSPPFRWFYRHVSEALDLKSDLIIDNASNIKVGIENVDVFLPNKNKDVLSRIVQLI